MARIELRDCTIRFKDGFGGSAAVDDMSIAAGNTTLNIDTVANLTNNTSVVPVGARFTIAGVADPDEFTVTDQNSNKVFLVTVDATSGNFTITFNGQTTASIAEGATAGAVQTALEALSNVAPGDVAVTGSAGGPWTIECTGVYEGLSTPTLTTADVDLAGGGTTVDEEVVEPGAVTWQLTFTPALVMADLPSDDDVITFLPQQIEIKVGDGDLTYTEANEYLYDLDRDELDTVREGADQPMEVNIDMVYEHITTGTNETITPMDALKRQGGAAGWVSSSADQCEPYAIDVEIVQTAPCGTAEDETTLFPDFRSESREVSLRDATISVSGRCNAVEPIVTRS